MEGYYPNYQQEQQQLTYEQLYQIATQYQQENQHLIAQNQQYRQQIQEYETANTELYNHSIEINRKYEKLSQQNHELQEQVDKLTLYYQDYERIHQENKELKQQIEELKQQIEQVEELKEIKEQYSKLMKQCQYVEKTNKIKPITPMKQPQKKQPIYSMNQMIHSKQGNQFKSSDFDGDDFVENVITYFQQQFSHEQFNIPFVFKPHLIKTCHSKSSVLSEEEFYDNMTGNYPTIIIKATASQGSDIFVIFGSVGVEQPDKKRRKESNGFIKDEEFFIAQIMRNGKLMKECYVKDDRDHIAYDVTDELIGIGSLFAITAKFKLKWENDVKDLTFMENGNEIAFRKFRSGVTNQFQQIETIVIGEWDD